MSGLNDELTVRSTPGETLFTRILGAQALASDFARWIVADLETAGEGLEGQYSGNDNDFPLRRTICLMVDESQRVNFPPVIKSANGPTMLLPLGTTPAIDAEMMNEPLLPPFVVAECSRWG
jgi:hypothetical protein